MPREFVPPLSVPPVPILPARLCPDYQLFQLQRGGSCGNLLWSLPELPISPKCHNLQPEDEKMRKLTAAALGLLALVVASLPAQAGHRRSCCNECAPECTAPMTVAWVDKEVTCYKTEWKERDVTCNVMR